MSDKDMLTKNQQKEMDEWFNKNSKWIIPEFLNNKLSELNAPELNALILDTLRYARSKIK